MQEEARYAHSLCSKCIHFKVYMGGLEPGLSSKALIMNGSNPPMFTLYIYARIGYLAACISNNPPTHPAFSSCAPQLSSKALIMHMPFVTFFILLLLVNEPGSGGGRGHTQIGLEH